MTSMGESLTNDPDISNRELFQLFVVCVEALLGRRPTKEELADCISSGLSVTEWVKQHLEKEQADVSEESPSV